PSWNEVTVSSSRVVYYTGMLALLIAILDLDMATIVNHYVLSQPLRETGWGRFLAMLPGVEHNDAVLQIGTLVLLGVQVLIIFKLMRDVSDVGTEG
ncbi:MAG: hypothetical protein KDB07_02890, partial [Planctomycetes bacterium]|nr:hypothetical protein [Planctomycetota bacterium]